MRENQAAEGERYPARLYPRARKYRRAVYRLMLALSVGALSTAPKDRHHISYPRASAVQRDWPVASTCDCRSAGRVSGQWSYVALVALIGRYPRYLCRGVAYVVVVV